MSGMSFTDSPFKTRVEYDAFLKLPAGQQAAALESETKKVSPCLLPPVPSWQYARCHDANPGLFGDE